MADNLDNRGPQDRTRINVNEPWEVEYWTKHFGVTEQRLREAVRAVGPGAEAVRQYL